MRQIKCYIQEYDNQKKARFRDRETGKKISFINFPITEKNNLLRFMGGARAIRLDIFSPNGSDYVSIEGNIHNEDSENIVFLYDENLTYVYK